MVKHIDLSESVVGVPIRRSFLSEGKVRSLAPARGCRDRSSQSLARQLSGLTMGGREADEAVQATVYRSAGLMSPLFPMSPPTALFSMSMACANACSGVTSPPITSGSFSCSTTIRRRRSVERSPQAGRRPGRAGRCRC